MLWLSTWVGTQFFQVTSPCLPPNIHENDFPIYIHIRLPHMVLVSTTLPLDSELCSLLVLLAWPVLDDPFYIPVLI